MLQNQLNYVEREKSAKGEKERGLGARGETRRERGKCRFLSDFVFPPLPKGLVLAPARVTTQKIPTDNLSVQKTHCAEQSPTARRHAVG